MSKLHSAEEDGGGLSVTSSYVSLCDSFEKVCRHAQGNRHVQNVERRHVDLYGPRLLT